MAKRNKPYQKGYLRESLDLWGDKEGAKVIRIIVIIVVIVVCIAILSSCGVIPGLSGC